MAPTFRHTAAISSDGCALGRRPAFPGAAALALSLLLAGLLLRRSAGCRTT